MVDEVREYNVNSRTSTGVKAGTVLLVNGDHVYGRVARNHGIRMECA